MVEIRFLLPLLFLIATAVALRPSSGEHGVVAEQREFDYFALALQWPGTICERTRHCCSSNGCCRSLALKEFTIHGLWPDYDDGSWPSCCNGPDFDQTKISSLMPLLEKYWPSLSCSSTSLCHGGRGLFWAHEWEKHGTCSSSVTHDEYSYFSTVLDLYFKYNITRILEDAGFLATNAERYPVGDVVAAIKEAVGASPQVVCKHGSLEELRLCFHKDFKPRDCITGSSIGKIAVDSTNSCPRLIRLPTYEPFAFNNQDAAGLHISQPTVQSWNAVDLIEKLIE